MVVFIPKRLDADSTTRVVAALVRRRNHASLSLDFRTVRFVVPFGTIGLLIFLRDFLAYRKQRGLDTQLLVDAKSTAGCAYLVSFGFFECLGLNARKSGVHLPYSSKSYMAITRIGRSEISFEGV